jgi:hypothetical protein
MTPTSFGAGSSLQGGAGGSAGPSTASSNTSASSGWNVNFGSGAIGTDASKWVQLGLIAAAAFVAWKLVRRGR